jgi:hypothetical protein
MRYRMLCHRHRVQKCLMQQSPVEATTDEVEQFFQLIYETRA